MEQMIATAREASRGAIAAPKRMRQAWIYTWVSVAFVLVMYLFLIDFFLVLYLVKQQPPSSPILVALIALSLLIAGMCLRVLFAARYMYGRGLASLKMVWVPIGLAAVFALLAFFDPFLGPVAVLPLTVALSFAFLPATVEQRRIIWVALALILAFYLWYSGQNPSAVSASYGSFVLFALIPPLTIMPTFWWWQVMLQLDEARTAEAELATARERLRIAGELHDIQGHHLQVIALKAELAARLVAKDPDAAEEAMREVQDIARNTMEDTRALVRGMRHTEFGAELVNAVSVLEGAGISARIDAPNTDVQAPLTEVLGLAVREATTNILRHSAAKHVVLSLRQSATSVDLRISNDAPTTPTAQVNPGSGLKTLRERVSELGGTVDTKALETEFILTITVPTASTSVRPAPAAPPSPQRATPPNRRKTRHDPPPVGR
ncbi:histidine kinase [Haematomicrobium sanguinis]|uniref:histidine kinase n=1 Tax=Haematomicrobium sanguinis TaxID=479106 RepID=UPI000AA2DA77|nr:histidine kinase [Haematomicrobium sanguinis]